MYESSVGAGRASNHTPQTAAYARAARTALVRTTRCVWSGHRNGRTPQAPISQQRLYSILPTPQYNFRVALSSETAPKNVM